MKFIQFSGLTAIAVALLALLLPTTAIANQVEETVLVFPGSGYATFTWPAQATMGATSGAHHGQLVQLPGSFNYYPNDDFWAVGSDVTLAHMTTTSPKGERETMLRIRWVVGQTAFDDRSVSMNPLAEGAWQPWELYSSSSHGIDIIPGVVADEAYSFTLTNEGEDHARMMGDIRRGDGSGTTTTTTAATQVEAIDPWHEWDVVGDISIMRWRQGQNVLGELVLQVDGTSLNQTDTDPSYRIKPRSSLDQGATGDVLSLGYNTLRLVRYNGESHAGAQFFINDILVDSIRTEPSAPDIPEIHELMLTSATLSPLLRISFEDPTTRGSEQIVDPTSRLIYDNFSARNSISSSISNSIVNVSSDWTLIGNQQAMSSSLQDLPGPGQRLDIDLSRIGTLQSSYLEKPLPQAVGTARKVAGHGLRYWFDPSALSLPVGAHISLVAACPPLGGCGALRMQLGRDAKGLYISATAATDDGQVVSVSTHITEGPHDIQVRFKNSPAAGVATGWLELWVDDHFAGRRKGLRNYTKQLQQIRFGALAKPAGATGILGLDEIEAWRFR